MASFLTSAYRWCKCAFSFLSSAKLYDEKSLKLTERILLVKAQVFCCGRLLAILLDYNSGNYYIKRAKLLRENNFADVNLEYQEAVLPTVEVAYVVIRVAVLLFQLLALKWPKLAGAFYTLELIGVALWNSVPIFEQSQQISLTYFYIATVTVWLPMF